MSRRQSPEDCRGVSSIDAPRMTPSPKIQLSRLCEIGWKLWDPIGLAFDGAAPNERCADEYDGYLLHVVGMILRGASKDEATTYLTSIESGHMGLSVLHEQAAAATSSAITDYLTSLSDDAEIAR